MTIRAQIENGPELEFPDDTPPDIIQQRVKEITDAANSRSFGAGIARQAVQGIPLIAPVVDKAQAAMEASTHLLRPGPGVSHAGGSGSMLDDWLQRYSEDLDREQSKDEAFRRQYPKSSLAAGVIGGTAATLPLAATTIGARVLGLGGQTLAGQIGRGIASGSAISGLDTALRGGSLGDVAKSAGLGGAVGGGLPLAARGVQIAGAPIADAVRSALTPEEEAVRQTSAAVQRGQAAAPTAPTPTPTPAGMQRAQSMGFPMMNVDIGGEPGTALAKLAANMSPEARQQLETALNNRFRGQAQRTSDWLNSTLNYPTEQARNEAIQRVRENVYEPMYARAYRDAAPLPLWPDADLMRLRGWGPRSPERTALENLASLVDAPDVQTAIRTATPMLRNWAVRDGLAPPVGAFRVVNDGGMPRTILTQTPSGNTNLPSLQLWDYIKRSLDGMGTPTSSQFAREIRNNLDILVPSYRTAREAAQPTKFFEGASNAYEAGQNYIGKGVRFGDEAARQIARMTPEEQNLFRDGYAQGIINQIEKRPDRLTILNQINQTISARREVERALGPTMFNAIEARMRVEDLMDRARQVVVGGPHTARWLHELSLGIGGMGGAGMIDLLSGHGPSAMITAALMLGARYGRQAINRRVAENVANLLVDPNPNRLRLGTATVARNPALMDALRNGSNLIARIATPETQQPH